MKTTEQLIEERNAIARDIYMTQPMLTETTAESSVEAANNLMKSMYGDMWAAENPTKAPSVENQAAENFNYKLSEFDHNGEPWLRVQALGEDFIIAPHDLDNGKSDFDYDTAMERLKELNLSTFNKRQLFIIGTLIEEINAKMEEIGGDKFAKDWYISSELYKPVGCADYRANDTWYFGGTYGVLGVDYRSNTDFRSRPVLALPLPN